MSFWSYLAIALAGTGAGLINTVVGSGSLITFPTLLFFGVNPLVANVSNNIGLVAGGRHRLVGLPARADGAGGHPAAPHAAVVRRVGHRRRAAARAPGQCLPGDRARAHPHRARPRRPRPPDPAVGGSRTRASPCRAGTAPPWVSASWSPGCTAATSVPRRACCSWASSVRSAPSRSSASTATRTCSRSSSTSSPPPSSCSSLVTRSTGSSSCSSASGAFVGGIIGAHVGRRIPPTALRALIVVIGVVAVVKLVWFS